MQPRAFDRQHGGGVELDVCFECKAIWFDQYESAQLTPGAVIALFRMVHDHTAEPTRPLADSMRCPHCTSRLQFTQDIQRTNRLAYHRCPQSHGRLTTFFQFLREKNFVRDLSRGEIEQLAVNVKQVRCSSCGAPIDLGRDTSCSHCRAAISVLDNDAVVKALSDLQSGELKRTARADPVKVAEAVFPTGAQRPAREKNPWLQGRTPEPTTGESVLFDLVSECIDRLFEGGFK
jgi:hypothetical protein